MFKKTEKLSKNNFNWIRLIYWIKIKQKIIDVCQIEDFISKTNYRIMIWYLHE